MSQKVLTVTQAKHKINTFGKALILYVIILTVFRYGMSLIEKFLPEVFFGYDSRMYIYIGLNLLMLLLSFIPFTISAKKLDINIKNYYKKIEISKAEIFKCSLYAIGINFITTSLMMIFSFFFNVKTISVSFLGNFTSVEMIIANIAYFIYMVITKPFCDEYAFRGVIQRSLGMFGRYFGVFASAILYALAQGNLVQAVPAFFIGIFLSMVSLKYHSIRPTIYIQSISAFYFYLINIIPNSFYWIVPVSVIIIYIFIGFSLFLRHRDLNFDFLAIGNKKLWKILFTSKSIITIVIIFIINVVLSFTNW